MKIIQPKSIKSPTFPIMISYDLKKYELYHYDFYRLKSFLELKELGIFENFKQNNKCGTNLINFIINRYCVPTSIIY